MATTTNGTVIFADWKTKGVFSLDPATQTVTGVVNPHPQVFFADFDVHPHNPQWIVAICEDHRGQVVSNTLVAINSSQQSVYVLASGADFYAFPRFSPLGDRVCWTQWNHPDMPWTGTELFVAAWADDGTVRDVRLVDGQAGQVSITQPRWGPDGILFFATDRSGYWQLSVLKEGSTVPQPIVISGLEKGEFAGADSKLGR
jgi:hypothetical protein